MRASYGHSTEREFRKCRHVMLTLASILISYPAAAQQPLPSGAVEEFSPVFDVAVAQRPRAGLYGITELMMAALEADIPAARRLIGAGADVNETDDSRSTPLMWAVHSGDDRIVQFLIDQGANVDAKAYQGATALINAISGKHEASAVALINAGADSNGRGNSSRNFLETAAESGMADVVDALIAHGADIETYGLSALSYAVSRQQINPVVSLLSAGVDVNSTDTSSKNTILFTAARTGNVELVELLILHGADAGQPSGHQSPLYPAVLSGNTTMMELLLENGAVATSINVLAAVRNGKIDTAKALLERLDIDTFEHVEVERLLEAADLRGDEEFVELLLSSTSAPSVDDHKVTLLFSSMIEESCTISNWNPRTKRQKTIHTFEGDCVDRIFVADGNSAVFILSENQIQSISLDNSIEHITVPYPVDDIGRQMQRLGEKFNEWLGGGYSNMDASRATPMAIGYLDNGNLGLATLTYGPADGLHVNLFGYIDGNWQFIAEQACGRMASGCPFPQLNGRGISEWPKQRRAWDPSIRKNPYFMGKGNDIARFDIGGAESKMRYGTDTYGHCGGDCTYASYFELVLPNGQSIILSELPSQHSIFENYFIIQRNVGSPDGTRRNTVDLFDMQTGESVLGTLQFATWVE